MFSLFGSLKRLGGIEFDKELCDLCRSNLEKLDIDNNYILDGDAVTVTEELDKYNYFYFYNPFAGKTFANVIENIEESYKRNKRRITLIYTNPFEEKLIKENSSFKLSKEIETDFSIKNAEIWIKE